VNIIFSRTENDYSDSEILIVTDIAQVGDAPTASADLLKSADICRAFSGKEPAKAIGRFIDSVRAAVESLRRSIPAS
jgi:hypothetical protein